jgi:hypothetical protein
VRDRTGRERQAAGQAAWDEGEGEVKEPNMTEKMYEVIRTRLFGGHKQNPFLSLLKKSVEIRGPIQGLPEEFSQILYELTRGELDKKNGKIVCEIAANGKKNLLKLADGSRFRVVKTRGELAQPLIIVTPDATSGEDLQGLREAPLSYLVYESLKIQDTFTRVAWEYRDEERRIASEKAAEERRILRESSFEMALSTIEKSKSGETIMIRGMQNIDALVDSGFVPCQVDNPDNWIDGEEFPGMRYSHAKSGIELLLTAREKLRPIEELNKLELYFLVNRSDDDPVSFEKTLKKFRKTKKDGQPYLMKEFRDDLIALVKYPEELKGRAEEDLGLIANEVGHVIDRRRELDEGILSYEAVFNRDTQAIIAHILKNKTPPMEIRKALDYFEYTGMIDASYKAALHQRIKAATSPAGEDAALRGDALLYDKRVKEIVTEVLRKIPKEKLTSKAVTIALAPYVNELGFGKLIKIRERILQLKEVLYRQNVT